MSGSLQQMTPHDGHAERPLTTSERKALIVNADDFGASPGVNTGILEAHRRGIVTSASLLVGTPWSRDAVRAAQDAPGLDLGLHADVEDELRNHVNIPTKRLRDALLEQIDAFEQLVGRAPSHLDSRHDVHRIAQVEPDFLQVARAHRLTLRGRSRVRPLTGFYGRVRGRARHERIGKGALIEMIAKDLVDGVSELICHPGHVDGHLSSPYRVERAIELRTLCDPGVRAALAERSVRLVRHEDVARAETDRRERRGVVSHLRPAVAVVV